MLKKVLILLVLAALAAGGFWYYQKKEERARDQNGPIIAYGNVDIRDVTLSFRVPGRISEILHEEGDLIQAGDVLARLDQEPYLNEFNLYAAQLEQAKAAREKLEKPYQRRERLARSGAISMEERDDAKHLLVEAQAAEDSAQAQLDLARTNLNDTEIISPSNGVILTRIKEPGAVVAAGEAVCSLALRDPVWVRTYVPEAELGHIYPGQKAVILTDSGGRYQGHVGFISPQAEFTPKNVETTQLRTDLVYRLRIIADNPDNGLRQGMPVTVQIERTGK